MPAERDLGYEAARPLEEKAKRILRALADRGYQAYFVGGCVRDQLAGRAIKDIDIATSAVPDAVMEMFPHTVPTGLKHGTVTVLVEDDPFEVTTFRTESAYEGHRRPEQVQFISDLHEDLRRRDFTMNAMALHEDGTLIDPYGGAADLQAGVLRCVGEPLERFREDALRMMRCVRFACEYALEVDRATWDALLELRPLLRHIAMERVRAELEKMIEGRNPARAVRMLVETGVLGCLKVELGLPPLTWSASLSREADMLGDTPEPVLRWAMFWLLWPIRSGQARLAMDRLTFPRKKEDTIRRILAFGEWMDRQRVDRVADDEARIRFIEGVLEFGKAAGEDWRQLARRTDVHRKLAAEAAAWLDALTVENVQQLEIGGKELVALSGRNGGPWLGIVLDRLLHDVAVGGLSNDRDTLLRRASAYIEGTAADA